MEEKDFAWVCGLLAVAGARVPLLETVFLNKEEVGLWVSNGKSGVVKKRISVEEPIRTSADVLRYFASRRDQERPYSSNVCVALIKGVRVLIDDQRVEEVAAVRGTFNRCTLMQMTVDERPMPTVYALRIDLQEEEYTTGFFVKRSTSVKECTDQRLFFKLVVYLKVVIAAIEEHRRKRVVALELNFIITEDGGLWLCGCTTCKVISNQAPVLTLSVPEEVKSGGSPVPTKPETDNLSRKKSTSDIEPKEKKTGAVPPLRINTPSYVRDEDDSGEDSDPEVPVHPESPNETVNSQDPHQGNSVSKQNSGVIKSIPQNGIPSPVIPSLPRIQRSTPKHPVNFYNPNFKEMLAMRYAKTQHMYPDDLDQIFNDMDSKLLKDDDPPSRSKRIGSYAHKKTDSRTFLDLVTSDNNRKRIIESFDIKDPSHRPKLAEPVSFRKSMTLRLPEKKRPRMKPHWSMAGSSLQKIIEKYRTEKPFEYVPLKLETNSLPRVLNHPALAPVSKYYFKLEKS